MKILGIHYPSKHELCRQHRPDFDMRLASALVEMTNGGEIEVIERDVNTTCFACRYAWRRPDLKGA